VRSALTTVSGHGAPDTALAMARDAVDVRLARLHVGTASPTSARRVVSCGLAGMTVAILPFSVGVGLLFGLSLLACPS
jgi:hypothetical protein